MATMFVELSSVKALGMKEISVPSSPLQMQHTQSRQYLEDKLISRVERKRAGGELPSLRSKLETEVLNPNL